MRKGVSDVWNNLNKRWVPGVMTIPAEGISAKSPFRETGFGPATVSLGTSGKFKLSFLLLLDGEQGKHIFFNFQKTEKYFPKCSGSESTRERTLRSKGNEEQRKGLSADTVSYSSKCLNQFLQQRAYSWTRDREKYVLYFDSGNVSWRKYLSTCLVEKETITFNFINCKGERKEK